VPPVIEIGVISDTHGLLRPEACRALQEEGKAAVVYGHSHRPENVRRGQVLYFNPGSAGPRRFSLPVTVGRLRLRGRRLEGEIIPLLD
jgi:predicted phosphodiesterase